MLMKSYYLSLNINRAMNVSGVRLAFKPVAFLNEDLFSSGGHC